MAAAGLYTIGGSFWEFGEPDWESTEYFMMFGVAEDHDSNPIKMGLSTLKKRGAKFVSVNPVKTGYSAIADEWIGVKPGGDGAFVLALIHELLRADKIDLDYLVRYTNAPWLVIKDPGAADDGLFARGPDGEELCWDANTIRSLMQPQVTENCSEVRLDDGRRGASVPDNAGTWMTPVRAAHCRRRANRHIRRIAAELAEAAFDKEIILDVEWTDWTGRKRDKMIVARSACNAGSAHQTAFISVIRTAVARSTSPAVSDTNHHFHGPAHHHRSPLENLMSKTEHNFTRSAIRFPTARGSPVDEKGAARYRQSLFLGGAGVSPPLMHMVITNAWKGDPYPIDTLFMFMANMSWNSSMNTSGVWYLYRPRWETGEYKIPFIILDAFWSETVPYADIVLPDTTYLNGGTAYRYLTAHLFCRWARRRN